MVHGAVIGRFPLHCSIELYSNGWKTVTFSLFLSAIIIFTISIARASWFDKFAIEPYTYSYMRSYTFRTIIEPDVKGFHGYVPILKGCHTWGKTIVETKRHLREAIHLYCESLAAHRETIPNDTSF